MTLANLTPPRPCLPPFPQLREPPGVVLARRDLARSGLYHLWSPFSGMNTVGCPGWSGCVRLSDAELGEPRAAVLIPPDERCGWSSGWPTYVRRPRAGPLPYQWPGEKIPKWYVWSRLFDLQDGRCACCPAPAQSIDHDHHTGLVRGLLCISCNRREPDCAARGEQRCARGPGLTCFRDYRQVPPAAGLGWIRLRPEKFRHRPRTAGSAA